MLVPFNLWFRLPVKFTSKPSDGAFVGDCVGKLDHHLRSLVRQLCDKINQHTAAIFHGRRFSAVVASFVVRTKLLNVEPG